MGLRVSFRLLRAVGNQNYPIEFCVPDATIWTVFVNSAGLRSLDSDDLCWLVGLEPFMAAMAPGVPRNGKTGIAMLAADEQGLRIRDTRGRHPHDVDARLAPYARTDLVGLRMTAPMIEAVDAWRQNQPSTMSRSQAIRSFVTFALTAAPVLAAWSRDPLLGEDQRMVVRDLMLACGGLQLP